MLGETHKERNCFSKSIVSVSTMQGDVNTPYKKLLLMYAVPQLNPLTFMHLMHTFDTNIAWQIQHIMPPTPSIKIEPGIPEHNPDKLIGYKNPMTEKRPQATSQKTRLGSVILTAQMFLWDVPRE